MLYLWANGGHLPKNQPPLAHTTTHNTQQQKIHKTQPPCPPCLPASSGSNFIGEYYCCMSDDRYWSPQQGGVTFIDVTICSVMLFTVILQAAAWRACGQKVSFMSYYLCLFCATALEQGALTSAIRRYFICWYPASTSHVSAWFRTRGGAPLPWCFQEERSVGVVVSVALLI